MIATILGWIIGLAFIGGGIIWGLGYFFAAGMASRQVENWELLPALWGIVPVMLGAFIIALVMR